MSNEYEIKVEGAVHTFEGGATRYSKDKGRFDLMPSDIIIKLLEQYSSNDNNASFSINDAIIAAYKGNYIDAVIIIANQHYKDEKCPVLAMLAELAIHFKKVLLNMVKETVSMEYLYGVFVIQEFDI